MLVRKLLIELSMYLLCASFAEKNASKFKVLHRELLELIEVHISVLIKKLLKIICDINFFATVKIKRLPMSSARGNFDRSQFFVVVKHLN